MSEELKNKKSKKVKDKNIKEDDKTIMKLLEFDFINQIAKDFKNEFKNVRIYGTFKDPLFMVKDIEKILGVQNLHSERITSIKEKIKICISTTQGQREVNVFTEFGLYNILSSSKTECAEIFREFVFVVLKRLRTEGEVKMIDAINDLKKLKEDLKEKDLLIEEEHKKALRFEKSAIKQYEKNTSLLYTNEHLRNDLENQDIRKLEVRIQYLQNKYMKKLYLIMIKPPPEYKDLYEDVDIDEEPNDDEQYVFTISSTPGLYTNDQSSLYVHSYKKEDKENLHKFLVNRRFGLLKINKKDKNKKIDEFDDDLNYNNIDDFSKYHNNKYLGSINNIMSCMIDYNIKIENEEPLF